MFKVTLLSRDGRFVFKKEFTNRSTTVQDIKEYLYNNLCIVLANTSKESIVVFFNKNALKDTIEVSSISNEGISLEFDYIPAGEGWKHIDTVDEEGLSGKNKEQAQVTSLGDDVETKDINAKVVVTIIENGSKISVDPNDLITKDGKIYYIQNRKKIITFSFLIELMKNLKITREDVVRVLVFTLLLFTNNGEILIILSTVFLLQISSKFFSKYHQYGSKNLDHFYRTTYMFVTSMFMIDHNRF